MHHLMAKAHRDKEDDSAYHTQKYQVNNVAFSDTNDVKNLN